MSLNLIRIFNTEEIIFILDFVFTLVLKKKKRLRAARKA